MADQFPTPQNFYDAEKDLRTVSAVSNSRDPDTGTEIDSWITRRGDQTDTLAGRLKKLGVVVVGTTTLGATLNNANEVVLNNTVGSAGAGNYYSWGGVFPKSVTPGTDPALIGSGYVPRSDNVLREGLASSGGASLVGTSDTGTVQDFIDRVSHNTVASMIANPDLKIGDLVKWAGYHNIFDGGGNTGVVVAAATGTNDGGSFFNLTNGLQVKADMSDGVFVDRWGPINPNADLAFEKAIAYAVAHPASGAFGPIVYCGNSKYYETSLPIFFPASPLVGIDLDMRKSVIKKVTNTPASGKASRLSRGGAITDVMNVDAVIIYDHPDNAYYVRGGIRGNGALIAQFGNGIWAPRCYLMNFDEVTIDASSGDYGWKTHDTFMCKFHSFQSIGANRPIWWANDGSNAATGTTCDFSRVWALNAKVTAWDMYGLLYSSYNSIGADNITAAGAQGAYRFELCNGHISGMGAENTNTAETIRFIGGQMTIDGLVTFSPTASVAWMRATDAARVSLSGARSDNVSGALTIGAICAETGATIIYDGSGPANGARKKDNSSRLIRLNELTGYIAEISFSVTGGALTITSSDGCSISRAAAGVYPVTFSSAQPDTNYRIEPTIESSSVTPVVVGFSSKGTNGFNLTSRDFAGVATDCVSGSIKIFR